MNNHLVLESSLDCPYKVTAQAIGSRLPAFNVGVTYPCLGGYNVPFSSFANSRFDLSLVRKLATAYLHVATHLDPNREQSMPQEYDYDIAIDSSWVIRRDRHPCSTLPNTFWADEPNWKFNHGGLAWEMHTIMSELADNIELVITAKEQPSISHTGENNMPMKYYTMTEGDHDDFEPLDYPDNFDVFDTISDAEDDIVGTLLVDDDDTEVDTLIVNELGAEVKRFWMNNGMVYSKDNTLQNVPESVFHYDDTF